MKNIFVAVIAFCTGLTVHAQDAVAFKLNPEIGKTQQSTIILKTDIDSPQPVVIDVNMNATSTPTKIDEGNIVIETMINNVQMDMQSGMETVSYSSEQEATDETSQLIEKQFKPLIGQTVTAWVSSQGKAVNTVLPEVGENTLSPSNFTSQFLEFPDHAIRPGDSWETSNDVQDNPAIAKMLLKNTFKEQTAEGYLITSVGTLFDEQGAQKGAMQGEFLLDTKTFMPSSSTSTLEMEMEGTKISVTVEVAID
ncbi:MAG: hypothetical protein ACTIJ2_02225 [Sphingobacteriaceae bacterium]